MILFFLRGQVDSDTFIQYCYKQYRQTLQDDSYPNEIEIIRQEGKKPIASDERINFNLSHSHGVIVLAISQNTVGIDIEKIRSIDYDKFKFIQANNEKDFFIQWTQKESWTKYTGNGILDIKKEIPQEMHFEHFDVFGSHHCCICAKEENIIAYEMDLNAILEEEV